MCSLFNILICLLLDINHPLSEKSDPVHEKSLKEITINSSNVKIGVVRV